MGEVYRARDPKLERDVAIKVLPDRIAQDADALSRFEREAKTIAALSHPNLVAIFDFGKEDSVAYAVMELLEGETLRQALTAGALPVRKAVEYGVQIAHGLASAHEKGIVHRDLKPDNVFVTADGRVKILDFGLAAHRAGPDEGGDTKSPTKTSHTDPGTVLGTAGYMSPEQVKGLRVDHRTDIFALGVVLYEMLTGRRAFHGDTAAETMAAILKEDVAELSGSGRAVPLSLDRLVRRCLEKRAEERFQSARDLAISLEAYSGADTATGFEALRSGDNRWTTAARAAALLALGILGGILFGQMERTPPQGEAQATFVDIALPPGVGLDPRMVRFSEDGRRILFKGADRLVSKLWLRDLDSVGAQPLPGTENAWPAGFFPDGRRFAFASPDWVLKSFDATTSSIKSIAPMPTGGIGMASATVNSTNDILLAAWYLLHASNASEAKVIALPDAALGEVSFDAPQFLPDGRRYLYSVLGLTPEKSAVYASALGSSERTLVLPSVSWAAYAPPGYLLFRKDADLFAQAFDVARLELSGQPSRIAEGVLVTPFRTPTIWVGGDALLFMRGAVQEFQLTWFDRRGRALDRVGDPAEIVTFDLSRDGHKVVASVGFPGGLSLIDTRSNSITRVTAGSEDADPRFSGDAQAVLFGSGLPGNRSLVALSLNGGSRKEVMRDPPVQPGQVPPRANLHDWSRDGRFVLFTPGMGTEIWSLPLTGNEPPSPVVRNRGSVNQARFSPDGRWVAYNAGGTGRMEVFVETFPSNEQLWQISLDGGVQPIWREDSGELFFLNPVGGMMSASVAAGRSFSAGPPRLLFRTDITSPSAFVEDYGVTGDGQRFLLRLPTAGSVPPQLTLVMNWPALLKPARP